MRRRPALAALALVAMLVAGLLVGRWLWGEDDGADPQVVASASVQSLREQNRLSAFVANYVAVVTASQSRFGLTARRTLIMPGLVRYEVDLGRLRDSDVRWDAAGHTLDVVLPPVEVVGPQVDLARIREYDGGGLLLGLTDAGKRLDQANRRVGQAELLRQAREPVPMNLAKDATRRAVERSFAMPLRAAGLEATVRIRFPDEPAFPTVATEQADRSRAVNEVMAR